MSTAEEQSGASGPAENGSPEKPARKVACTECRQQKVRCDVNADSLQSCSRCKKFNLPCNISTPFKRTSKRKLEELEEETSRLRQKLDQVTPSASIERQPSNLPPPATPSEPLDSHTHPLSNKIDPPSSTPQDVFIYRRPNLSGANGGYPADRVIDGLRVDSQTIVDTFGLFYEYYAALMPVTDPAHSPDDYYMQYPLIFWMIVSVGSRRYTKDGTLLLSLAPRVTQLALESLKEPRGRTVQGLALLATWPFPTDTSSKDITFTISAALVHIAIRVGLHMPRSIQDFHRTKVELSERKVVIRAEAWICCLLVYQRASCMYGAAPSAWVASTFDFQWKQALSEFINPSLLFQFKLQRLQSQANMAVIENGCDKASVDQKRAFTIILKIFDKQIKDMEDENPWIEDLNRFYVVMARLQVIGLHLFRPFEEIEPCDLMQIYVMACSVITLLHKCDSTVHLISVCPDHVYGIVMLAGSTLLRLLKSSFAQYIDEKDGKAHLLDCINVLKLMSCANNDLPARYSQILAQLWTSDKVFKYQDGSTCLNLRIRSRFAVSLILDCVWWWREEFGGQPGVYSKNESSSAPSNVPPPALDTFENLYGAEETMFLPFLEDQMWSGIDWNFDPNLAMPIASAPAEPTGEPTSRPDHWPNVPPVVYD